MNAKLTYSRVGRPGNYQVAMVKVLKVESSLNKADVEVVSSKDYFEPGKKIRVAKDRLTILKETKPNEA